MTSCRFCGANVHKILDLGHQPPSNSFLTREQLREPETHYPLELFICNSCALVQIKEAKKVSDIFTDDYVYYSSESPANVTHAKEYCEMMMNRYCPRTILEVGSNDGYLLQHFHKAGREVYGVDPAKGPALEARRKGIFTYNAFFGKAFITSQEGRSLAGKLDLICGINVLNHQSDINDFVDGLKMGLAPNGVITFEFPHLLPMIKKCEWDTIYHEHLNYYSLDVICKIFLAHDLWVFDVDEIPEHGGSLRIYATHKPAMLELPISANHKMEKRMGKVISDEAAARLTDLQTYYDYAKRVTTNQASLRKFVRDRMSLGSTFAAYGAAAKANTLFNSCGLGPHDIKYVVDRSPYKITKFLPGSHIPVVGQTELLASKPDYVIVTAWNFKEEIMEQLAFIGSWGGAFVIPIPEVVVISPWKWRNK